MVLTGALANYEGAIRLLLDTIGREESMRNTKEAKDCLFLVVDPLTKINAKEAQLGPFTSKVCFCLDGNPNQQKHML